jgi:hypothetical protein
MRWSLREEKKLSSEQRRGEDREGWKSAIARVMGASTPVMGHRHGTPRGGTGWRSKVDRLGCTGPRPVPSLQGRKGLESEGKPPMGSQPDMTGSVGSRNVWLSTAVRNSWLLTARASSVVGGVWHG